MHLISLFEECESEMFINIMKLSLDYTAHTVFDIILKGIRRERETTTPFGRLCHN